MYLKKGEKAISSLCQKAWAPIALNKKMSEKKSTEVFDKKEEFEKHCQKLLDELMLQCSLYKIPCFFTACVGNTPDKSEYIHAEDEGNARYINDAVCAGSRDIHLTDDQIKKHLCVVCGFDVVPSRKALEVDMEEIFTEEPADDIFLGVDEDY